MSGGGEGEGREVDWAYVSRGEGALEGLDDLFLMGNLVDGARAAAGGGEGRSVGSDRGLGVAIGAAVVAEEWGNDALFLNPRLPRGSVPAARHGDLKIQSLETLWELSGDPNRFVRKFERVWNRNGARRSLS